MLSLRLSIQTLFNPFKTQFKRVCSQLKLTISSILFFVRASFFKNLNIYKM